MVGNSFQTLSESFEYYLKKYEVFENDFVHAHLLILIEYRDLMMSPTEKTAKLFMLEYFTSVESSSDSSESIVEIKIFELTQSK